MSTATAAPTGRDFGRTFDTTFDSSTGMRQGGTADRVRNRLVLEERLKLERQGYEPATIINLNPFVLRSYMGELGVVEVPAATPEAPVQRLVIRTYRLSMRDMGDGNFAPVSVLPTELAQEVGRDYEETGGVFWYRGAGEPPAEELAAAKERQMAWYRREYQKAVDAWSRYHQYKFITDRQRDAARALYQAGEIAQLPEWLTITRAQSDRVACPMCGEDIKREAKICRFCHSRVDIDASMTAPPPQAAAPAQPSTPASDAEDVEDEVPSPRPEVSRADLAAFDRAQQSWRTHKDPSLITDRQREAARALHAVGNIATLPEWAQ